MELGVDMMDYLRRAKSEGIIRARGTSCHGMDPLRSSAADPFVEVDLARINPEGLVMDDKKPDEVASRLQEMHNRYVLGLDSVDSFGIGFENAAQVGDILKRTNDAIAATCKD